MLKKCKTIILFIAGFAILLLYGIYPPTEMLSNMPPPEIVQEPPSVNIPEEIPAPIDANEAYPIIGNPKSRIYHRSTCAYLPAENNRIYLTDPAQADFNRYRPCDWCGGAEAPPT